ncbi:MAG TPA: tRNA (N(6)-L-threonylcarbamoyladenosine(37)-C(2))-methylthiotransferase MtaB [Dehalococcoidia bacterium]|nr:tRNA (N(6)-L-threonylcarbamoyladenosine(37)-C(2))-methylthiotransferase MtaB [Dehalococcoidia bacterium]
MPWRDATGEGEGPGAVCPGTVAIQTHGCKLNQADSQALARDFAQAGFRLVDSPAEAQVFVLNTCTVTATADAKARQALRAARRANPQVFIVAAGCYPQRAAASVAALDAVSLVVDNTQKQRLVPLVLDALASRRKMACEKPASPPYQGGDKEGVVSAQHQGYDLLPPRPRRGSPRRTRATVKIQEGCDQVCAYCIVPRVRGRERSIPPENLIGQIDQLVSEGHLEVVLTGTQLGAYGFDIPGASLAWLLERILDETQAPRLRVSSLQAHEITPELLARWRDPRLCPHFHVPLQSGSDAVLKAMRRRYDAARFAETLAIIRQALPYAGITTDLMVGFPGEGEDQFRESMEFARAMRFSDLHVFSYSPRPGTSAAHFPGQVAGAIKQQRAAQVLELAQEASRAFRAGQLGQTRPVLWELAQRKHQGAPAWSGLTDNYIRVYTTSPASLGNSITPATLLELDGDWVRAAPLRDC